jgi:hypothetical protein
VEKIDLRIVCDAPEHEPKVAHVETLTMVRTTGAWSLATKGRQHLDVDTDNLVDPYGPLRGGPVNRPAAEARRADSVRSRFSLRCKLCTLDVQATHANMSRVAALLAEHGERTPSLRLVAAMLSHR